MYLELLTTSVLLSIPSLPLLLLFTLELLNRIPELSCFYLPLSDLVLYELRLLIELSFLLLNAEPRFIGRLRDMTGGCIL